MSAACFTINLNALIPPGHGLIDNDTVPAHTRRKLLSFLADNSYQVFTNPHDLIRGGNDVARICDLIHLDDGDLDDTLYVIASDIADELEDVTQAREGCENDHRLVVDDLSPTYSVTQAPEATSPRIILRP